MLIADLSVEYLCHPSKFADALEDADRKRRRFAESKIHRGREVGFGITADVCPDNVQRGEPRLSATSGMVEHF